MNAGLILRVASRRNAQNERDGAGLRSSIAAATPSQLRRSSAARSISSVAAASAPSQQHQLRRGRDAQNERDGAGLRSSVAAATPSHLRRSSATRIMSGRRGIGQPLEIIEQHLDGFATVTSNLVFQN